MMATARSAQRAKPRRGAARGSGPDPGERGSPDAKLRPGAEPRIVRDPKTGDRLLVPTPLLVAEEVARTRRGRVITITELRAALAQRLGADRTCPLTLGRIATVLAGVVSDDLKRKRAPRWPIWRLVGDDGVLNPKWPLAARYRATLLREEGLRVTRHAATWRVLPPAQDGSPRAG